MAEGVSTKLWEVYTLRSLSKKPHLQRGNGDLTKRALAPIVKIETGLFGAAGEHYVASQLIRRGLIAGLAPKGAPNIDIIVSDLKRNVLTDIQVKTCNASSRFRGWQLNEKQEDDTRENLIYCFVAFHDFLEMPRTWIIPSALVAQTIGAAAKAWIASSSKSREARRPSSRRWIRPSYPHLPSHSQGWLDPYEEGWDLITDRML